MEMRKLSRVGFLFHKLWEAHYDALEILDVIRTTKTLLDVSSESGVHMITGPDYVMTTYQLQILLIFKGQDIKMFLLLLLLLLLPGAELPLMVESFGLLNDLFPFPSILDAGYPVFDLHLANVLFDVILPSVLGSSLCSYG